MLSSFLDGVERDGTGGLVGCEGSRVLNFSSLEGNADGVNSVCWVLEVEM